MQSMDFTRKESLVIYGNGVTIFTQISSEPLKDNIKIHQATEFVAYCYFEGKIDQESKFEAELCNNVINQIKNSNLSGRCLALIWIYFQAHARHPLCESAKVK